MSGLPPTVRIDVVEDQQLTRLSFVDGLHVGAGPRARVRGFASVEELVAAGDPGDVVLLDLGLNVGGVEGPAAVEMLVRRGQLVLVVSGARSAEIVDRAHAAGACGYVCKDFSGVEEVLVAIAEVLAGRSYVDPKLLENLGAAARKKLTPRQQEVLRLEALGNNIGQIARRLKPPLSEAGVKRHIERIKEIYPECTKQSDRVRLALRLGLITPWELPGP